MVLAVLAEPSRKHANPAAELNDVAINRHAPVLAVGTAVYGQFPSRCPRPLLRLRRGGSFVVAIRILARSYLRFDSNRTLGMPVLTVGQLSTAPIVSYPDHPPLIPLLIAPFYTAFGVGEWQTRLPISFVTICAVYADGYSPMQPRGAPA